MLPCVVEVLDAAHPLRGERLKAMKFQRRGGVLRLVVVLPDGTPGMVPADATDVFGADRAQARDVATTLSVDGVRRLRAVVGRATEASTPERRTRWGRAKPWKVVRHEAGVDPFERLEWVYSAHTTELAAQRARDRARAVLARSAGVAEAARWAWSVRHDPADVLTNSPRTELSGRGGVR